MFGLSLTNTVFLAVVKVDQKSWWSLACQLLLKPLIIQHKIPLTLLLYA